MQNSSWAATFETAAENATNAEFKAVLGTTGGPDRLLILFNDDRFDLIGNKIELSNINIGGNVRAPLVIHLRENNTGTEFLFMVNHLYRTRSTRRHMQAELLNEWAANQQLPVIAVGDYNFDWDVEDGDTDHDEGYDNMIAEDVFKWIKPQTLIKTQASPDYNSVLDFVFTSKDAKSWAESSEIIVKDGDFPDDNQKSDHRPVRAWFDLSNDPEITKEDILREIRALKEKIEELERLVERL